MALPTPACHGGADGRDEHLLRLGLSPGRWDLLIALAGNPNVGKSTVFNALTGLRQHTGNWPGKTIARAEGAFAHRGSRVKIVDLPGTYSLQAGSVDEEVARDFILFGRPDVTVVVIDATRLERNLNLTLQILEITGQVVIFLNLVDEAKRHGIAVDAAQLERELGVPVVAGAARSKIGTDELIDAAYVVATGAADDETVPDREADAGCGTGGGQVGGRRRAGLPGSAQQPVGGPAAAERRRRRGGCGAVGRAGSDRRAGGRCGGGWWAQGR